MIDEELLIGMIRKAASGYSCDASDRDFEVVVRIKCNNGWASAEIVKSRMKKQKVKLINV